MSHFRKKQRLSKPELKQRVTKRYTSNPMLTTITREIILDPINFQGTGYNQRIGRSIQMHALESRIWVRQNPANYTFDDEGYPYNAAQQDNNRPNNIRIIFLINNRNNHTVPILETPVNPGDDNHLTLDPVTNQKSLYTVLDDRMINLDRAKLSESYCVKFEFKPPIQVDFNSGESGAAVTNEPIMAYMAEYADLQVDAETPTYKAPLLSHVTSITYSDD